MSEEIYRLHLTAEEYDLIRDALKVYGKIKPAGALFDKVSNASLYTPATDDEIAAARERHTADEIGIDEGAGASHAVGGYWVEAWVWVPQEESDEASE